ncbi:hypothetical protein [Pyrococcus yayanosii]|uniref:Oligosaccharide repeat unit polymerase n=1 Tax=Pyrococcus yayanosii (strain CH1 / JCM 16557) TaxID=529709 RepID=F8AGF5_PYRYC|nr:hypothetical protein [Pyrococcus yayanosii]AEH25151.1 hypothetical protein PYCH_14830 [Pyrococcus yayanosii CH1]
MRLHHLIPIILMIFVALGMARPKTILVVTIFSLSMIYGFHVGGRIRWSERPLPVREDYIVSAFWLSLLIVLLQLLMLRQVPLLDPSIRTQLNPRLTALTYFLGMPLSVYLFLRGRRYALLYPFVVSLYAYRTPVLVSLIALGAAYYEEKGLDRRTLLVGVLAALLFLLLNSFRNIGLGDLLTRVVATTSVLDVIVWRCSPFGFYHGVLQWAGVRSYFLGGYSPRMLISKYLLIRDVTTTATLIGGIYLDFGLLGALELFLLGFYYEVLGRAKDYFTRAIYYSTLAYGIVGVETGILDLPVYALFLLGSCLILRGLITVDVKVKRLG